jgi:PKD repeat protein
MQKSFLLFVLCLFVISCKKDPTADFSTSGSLKVGELTEFTNLSSHYSVSLWDFGDGKTSNENAPSHKYEMPGNYMVNLDVTGNGKTESIKKTVIITGTTYVIKNTTSARLINFASFYWNGYDIIDFQPYGILEPGQSTNIIITTRPEIEFGFRFVEGGAVFVCVYPFKITQDIHNILVIDNNTMITSGSKKSGDFNKDINQDEKILQFNKLISR